MFKVKRITHRRLARRKRRIRDRLAPRRWKDQPRPMLRVGNIRYELAQRDCAITCGGIGAVHLLAQHVGLPQAIDRNIRMLKRHVPYFESDHALTLAYNILADGSCTEDLELLRNNEGFMDALGAQRLPNPTTAGDFCRRFETDDDVLRLQETINEVRLTVWMRQEPFFFKQAMRNPLENLHSNPAYMVMCSLAWTLRAWCGLLLPITPGRWESHHREERPAILRLDFKRFRSLMLRIPCQIAKTGRRIIYRILSWDLQTSSPLRLADAMYYPMRC